MTVRPLLVMYLQSWCQIASEEKQVQLLQDVHTPSPLRYMQLVEGGKGGPGEGEREREREKQKPG